MYEFKTKLEPFGRGFLSCESDNKSKKTAAGLLSAAKEMNIKIDPKTGLCFAKVADMATVYEYGCAVYCNNDYMNKLIEKFPDDARDLEYIRKNIQPYIKHHKLDEYCYSEEYKRVRSGGHIWGGGWMGHSNPNFHDVCILGTDGIRAKIEECRAKNPGKDEFYDASSMTMDAIDILGRRFRELADSMLKTASDDDEIRKLEIIKKTFENAPAKPCRDFAEAVIVYVLVFSFDGIDSPGHFDQYMYDFWKKTDPELRQSYLESIWEFFHQVRAWNLCLSGSDENWNDLTNDLTYAILDLVKKYKYETPNLTLRWHRNTPEKLMEAVYDALTAGTGLPALYNDEVVCPALENLGIPPCDSHRYVMNGCNQIDIQGKSHMGLEDGEVLIAKAVELVLRNGISATNGVEVGLRTGDPSEFKTYEEFYDAFLKQLDYATELSAEMANSCQRTYAEHAPNPLRTALIEGCLENGLDYKNGGPLYGNGQILAEGIADAVDSLAAIKKYVYEERRFTIAELVFAMQNNFIGFEEMHNLLKNSELKFGNDIEYVDSIAKDVVDHFNRKLLTIETFRGGHFSGGCSPFNRAAGYGRALAALPNGRRWGEALLADSIGATPGFDTNGPTALINSCLSFDHKLAGSGFILNVKFDKSMFASESGKKGFIALWRSYFERDGQMLTVTVVSEAELRDAQVNPDAHRNLIVRVGGYSDYFVNLSRDLQENVISRSNLNV